MRGKMLSSGATSQRGAVGTLAGETSLPAACAPGAYSIVLTARDKQTAYFPFSVAEYRKPEFLVTVAPSRHRYLSGEAAAFTVKAAYYFGAPLPQAKVKYQIRRSPNPFRGIATDEDETARWYASGDGNLYERDTYTADPFIAEGEVYTDAHGQAQIPFKTRAGLPDSTYTVTCTTVDAQRRQVDATGETPVYAAARRIGVRTRVMASPLGGLVPIEIALTDQDDKPVGGSVALLLRHQVYDEKKGTYHTRDLTQTRVNVPKTGRATATVPAMAPGSLEVLATVVDPTGRKAQAALNVWVAGRRDVPSLTPTEDPAVSLKLDRRTYAPGDTAQVFATTNTPGRPTLLVVEGGDFFSWIVFPARPGKGDTLLTWKVPVGVAMSPNAHISATQWARPAQVISSNIILPVPDKTRHITVSVTPDKTAYRPGDKATYTIQTRDGLTGKPVAGAEVAFAVTDASIFALRPDTTADPYAQFWGLRQNLTETLTSAPEEVSGGAYQRNSPNGVAPVREKFLDTAFWSAHVITGADGTATATVEMPGNLTSWRASALAVTGDTKVGRMVSTVSVSRPVMLRLATPRQFVQGDSIEIIATVHNQTTRAHTFEVALDAAGLSVEGADAKGQAVASVVAAPKSETKYRFRVKVGDVPESRLARISGTLIATDPLLAGETTNDLSDAVRLSVPVVPRGFGEHITVGGTLAGNTLLSKPNAALTLDLPADRIEPATLTTVRVTSGVEGTARAMAGQIVRFPAYGVETAAAQLLLAATPGSPQPDRRTLRDALAYLSRAQSSEGGWGLWDGALADATTTAHVLQALEAVRQQPRVLPFGVPFPDGLYKRGVAGAHYLYNQTNLWEERTLLAAALAPDKKSQLEQSDNLDEVQTRGTNLSPYATLALADALGMGNRGKGNALVKGVLDTALVGPTTATIPEGSHPGWRASQAETTAQALVTLLHRGQAADLQGKLAHWLAHPTDGEDTRYYSVSEQAAIARALLLYQAARGGASSPANVDAGDLTLTVGGVAVAFNKRAAGTEDQPLTATVPTALLKTGANTLALHRLRGRGELFIEADATVYRPHTDEADRGLRVLRRWEAQNPWGTWQPLPPTGAVSPSAPVRVTVLAWPAGDDTDALRITEPLPSGFEVVDSDALSGGGREEVRDGAVIHYVRSEGATPVTFRYYLRAEAAGNLLALPATGEVIRRPSVRGNSSATALVVSEETAKP